MPGRGPMPRRHFLRSTKQKQQAQRMRFTDWQLEILRMVQADLPHTRTPYEDMAEKAGVAVEDVLAFLQALKKDGVIRRFGASIRHQKTVWKHNAMVAWIATEEEAAICGPVAARHPGISHSYFRPSDAPDWPYTFYTMIHGRDEEECGRIAEELRASWAPQRYAMLRTMRELKKISPTYFRR